MQNTQTTPKYTLDDVMAKLEGLNSVSKENTSAISTLTSELKKTNNTIDDLAIAVAKGFKETNGYINKLETRFDNLEERFDGLETRFDGLETRFDGLETRFDGLETQFGDLGEKFDDMEKTMTNNHGHRLRKIENKLQLA